MDIEKNDKKLILQSNLINKMKKAQSISKNLTKIVKIAERISPSTSRTPIEQSFHSNIQAYEKCGILTTRHHNTSGVRSGDVNLIGQKCRNCEKTTSMLRMAKQEKESLQNKYSQLVSKCSRLQKEKKSIQSKLVKLEKALKQTNTSIQPYKNNVILMERHLESIKQSLSHPFTLPTQYATLSLHSLVSGQSSALTRQQKDVNEQLDQKKKEMDYELNYLMKSYQRQQQNTQTKLNRLTLIIHILSTRNNELHNKISQLQHQLRILTSIIKQSAYTVQQRELFHMSSQQLYQTKLQLYTMKQNNNKLNKYIDKLCNKISMLTSLIGYGVISNIQNNDLHQIYAIKANLGKIGRLQEKICGEGISGGISGRSMKICGIKEFVTKQTQGNVLHQPTFLIYFQDQQIKTGLQQNVTTIIKPQFFILIRAILDAKYCQFLTEGTKATRFQQFTYAFIQFFKVTNNYRRVQACFKRSSDQKELMKNNFLLRVFDKKLAYLPEIATFREFLMKNSTQDQIFYYLMCRNLLYSGPELNTYIGSSDPYNFIPYQRAIQRIQPLLQQLDKSSKTMIFKHINEKKVLKNNKLLLKTNYVLRILLQIYRKIRRQRVHKLRLIFEQTLRLTKCQIIKYIHFKQILSRNFGYLTHLDIGYFYRKTLAVVQADGDGANGTFFDTFVAVSMEDIMLKDLIIMDQKIRSHYFSDKSIQRCNYLMQLIPDSVSQLGQQSLYNQYTSIIKHKSLDTGSRIQTGKLLLKMISLLKLRYRYDGNNSNKQEQGISTILDEFNNNLIDAINANFRRRKQYQLSLERASSIIGTCFKKKIYQFYQEFVKDIKISLLVAK